MNPATQKPAYCIDTSSLIRGWNAADPWIIALAEIERGHGTVVVTEENEDNSSSNPKIPLVCRHYGIEFIRLLDLIRIERWQF